MNQTWKLLSLKQKTKLFNKYGGTVFYPVNQSLLFRRGHQYRDCWFNYYGEVCWDAKINLRTRAKRERGTQIISLQKFRERVIAPTFNTSKNKQALCWQALEGNKLARQVFLWMDEK